MNWLQSLFCGDLIREYEAKLDELDAMCIDLAGRAKQTAVDLRSCEAKRATLTNELRSAKEDLLEMPSEIKRLKEANSLYATQIAELGKEIIGHHEMFTGPVAPRDTRILTKQVLNQFLARVWGEPYINAKQLFSDGSYLVAQEEEIRRYTEFYTRVWLPRIKEYLIQKKKWQDSDIEVDIYARDCDDFADFFQGHFTLYPDWVGLPWGQVWGTMPGGHAWNFTLAYNPSRYDEKRYVDGGLTLLQIEPQRGEVWSREPQSFEATQIWMVKL